MDNLFCITLCLLIGGNVIGQKLVSHREGVGITASNHSYPLKSNSNPYNRYFINDGFALTYATMCRCCFVTEKELNPWFKMDLGYNNWIQRIHVLGQTDYINYLYRMEIQLGTTESDESVLQGVDTKDPILQEMRHTLDPPVLARFITLTLRDRIAVFVICELYVYAYCIDGRYGSACTEKCGHCANNDVCDKDNGYCPRGCSAGFNGTNCKQDIGNDGNVCNDGRYGPNCDEECGQCYSSDICNRTNGTCPYGCSAGYKGSTCKEVCQPGTYGFGCTKDCGMCRNEDVCDRFTGSCPRGCIDGYQGSKCSTPIAYTCISLPVFVGSLSAVIFVNTTSGLLWWLYQIYSKETESSKL